MPEVNTEKIFASFLLSVEQVTSIDEFNDLEKEYLGKNSLISEERKKLSSMSEISRKKYGKVLQELSTQISERLNQERLSFQSKFFKEKELNDNKDITINWYKDVAPKSRNEMCRFRTSQASNVPGLRRHGINRLLLGF